MKIKKNNYEKYQKAQKKMVKRHQKKLKSKQLTEECSFATKEHLDFVIEKFKEHKGNISDSKIICHGVRNGYESKFFMDHFSNDNVYSTDIIDTFMLDKTNFFEQDFDTNMKEWENKFDFLYSNVIDHSQNPGKTLEIWSKQVKVGGLLFIQFHGGNKVTNADCFALSLENYKEEIFSLAKDLPIKIIDISKKIWRKYNKTMNVNVILRKCQ